MYKIKTHITMANLPSYKVQLMQKNKLLSITLILLVGCTEHPLPTGQPVYNNAEKGAVDSQYQLANAYMLRSENDNNYDWPTYWWQRSAKSQDLLEAMRWYRKAAKTGHAPSQTALGIMYYQGIAVKRDKDIAAQWFQQAAAVEHPDGLFHLAKYHHDLAIKKAYVEVYANSQHRLAFKYFQAAASSGHPAASYWLGQSFEQGWGIEKNNTEAERWYNKSIQLGHQVNN